MEASGTEVKRQWRTRPFREGDEAALIELTGASTGSAPSIDRWRWLFEEGPGGKGLFSLGDHDGRIVGQYVILRQRVVIDGREVHGSQSLETMTHPEYRKQGMFVTLAKEVYDRAAREGVSMVYGFPNTSSHHGFVNRLGFSDFMVPIHVRPLRTGRLLRSKTPLGRAAAFLGEGGQWAYDRLFHKRGLDRFLRYRIGSLDRLDDSFDGLWKRSRSMFPNMVVRDRAYLDWRYLRKPGGEYTILAAHDEHGALAAFVTFCTIHKDGVRQGHVVDLLTDPDAVDLVYPLLSKAVDMLREEGAEIAACMLLPGSPYFGSLKRLGFLVAPKKLPFIVRTNGPDVALAGMTDPSRWHITIGDSDFI